MVIKIKKCSEENSWYKQLLGFTWEVLPSRFVYGDKEYFKSISNKDLLFKVDDCEIIEIEKVNESLDKENDMVDHPAHYTFSKFEVLDVLTEWFPEEPLLWQVCKYISRAKHKGKELEDLKKARFYLNKKIEMLENQDVNN